MDSDFAPADVAHRAGAEAHLRVARNTIVLVALRVLMPALAVALVLMLSRHLGAGGLGRYTLAFSFLYMFNAIAPLGLGALITRDGARNRAGLERLLGNAMMLGSFTSVVLTLLMSALAYLLDYDSETRMAIVILSLAILPCAIGMLQDSAFVALERMDYIAIGTIAEYAIKVGVGIALILTGYGLAAVLVVAIIGRVCGCVISAHLLRRAGLRVRWSLESDTVRKLLRLAPAFLLIGIFATLYWRIDIFMLSKMRPVEDVGYYGAAWRVLELAMVVPQSLCLALYPQISAAAPRNLTRLSDIGKGAMRYLLAISLPTAIGVTLLAQPVMTLLYGRAFGEAASTLAALILTLVPYGFVRYHAYVLVGANRQRIDLLLNVIMSAANIALNLALIPRYGPLGAAIATLISICAYGLLQYAYLRTRLPGYAAPFVVPPLVVVACAVMAAGVWTLREVNMSLAIVIGVVLYAGCLIAGRFFSGTELTLLGVYRLRGVLRRG